MAIERAAQSRSNHERGACPYGEHRYVPEGPSKALTHVKRKPMKRAADECGDGTSRKTENPKLSRFACRTPGQQPVCEDSAGRAENVVGDKRYRFGNRHCGVSIQQRTPCLNRCCRIA